jgi:hypothetical protein
MVIDSGCYGIWLASINLVERLSLWAARCHLVSEATFILWFFDVIIWLKFGFYAILALDID